MNGAGESRKNGAWPAAAMLVLSVALGFALGALRAPTWQVAVETAQVLAGEVAYPAGNPFLVYHLKAWTIIHQIAALLLCVGLSEWSASVIVSGLLGGLSFASLSLAAYALCKRPLLSLFAPVFVYALYWNGFQHGLIYPVVTMGYAHSYGVLARGFVLAALAVLACGRRRTGFFLLGAAPCVHAVWGTWALLAGLLACAAEPGWTYGEWRRRGAALAMGLVVAFLSLGVQQFYLVQVPEVDAAEAQSIARVFIKNWDFHRHGVSLLHHGGLLAVAALLLCGASLLPGAGRVAPPAQRLLIALMLSASALPFAWFLETLRPWMPWAVQAAMPGRLPNLAVFALPAAIIGIAGRERGRMVPNLVLAGMGGYLVFNLLFMLLLRSDKYGWTLSHGPVIGGFALLLAASRMLPRRIWAASPPPWVEHSAAAGIAAACAVGVLAAFTMPDSKKLVNLYYHCGPENSAIAAARKGTGLLLVGGEIELAQLRTGRPLLLNMGGLDQLPYVPESGPAMASILRRVYGVDIWRPPEDGSRELLPDGGRAVFEARTPGEWRRLRQEFGVTEVLVWRKWELQLPKIAEDNHYALYHIPSESE